MGAPPNDPAKYDPDHRRLARAGVQNARRPWQRSGTLTGAPAREAQRAIGGRGCGAAGSG